MDDHENIFKYSHIEAYDDDRWGACLKVRPHRGFWDNENGCMDGFFFVGSSILPEYRGSRRIVIQMVYDPNFKGAI